MCKNFVCAVIVLPVWLCAHVRQDILAEQVPGPVLGLYSLLHQRVKILPASDTPSDRRIKTDVESLNSEQMLSDIKRLRPIKFRYTDEWQRYGRVSDSTQLGFIAQEVEEVFPDVVRRWPSSFPSVNGQMYSLEISKLVPGLVSACQELDKKLVDVDRRVAGASSELDALEQSKKRIAKLERIAIAALCCASLSVTCLASMGIWHLAKKHMHASHARLLSQYPLLQPPADSSH